MPHESEMIQVVDEHDAPLRGAGKNEIWREGLYHRIVRIMIRNEAGDFLMQLRTHEMDLYPDCWDQSAGGHVDEGEDYDTAARREMMEEIGLTADLREVGYYESNSQYGWRKLNRFNKVYEATVSETPTQLQAEEVASVKWMSAEAIKQMLADDPDHATDGLHEIFTKFY